MVSKELWFWLHPDDSLCVYCIYCMYMYMYMYIQYRLLRREREAPRNTTSLIIWSTFNSLSLAFYFHFPSIQITPQHPIGLSHLFNQEYSFSPFVSLSVSLSPQHSWEGTQLNSPFSLCVNQIMSNHGSIYPSLSAPLYVYIGSQRRKSN